MQNNYVMILDHLRASLELMKNILSSYTRELKQSGDG